MGLAMKLPEFDDQLILSTLRLNIRKLNNDDAGFILKLLNEPAFLRFIGDRHVRNLEDALDYLKKGPFTSYEQHGFGLWLVQLKSSAESLGICGLIKRDTLPDVDIGYAFLERYWSNGFASEATASVKGYALQVIGLPRLLAITDQENAASIRVLEKIGFRFERLVRLSADEPELNLFTVEASPG